MKLAVIFNGQGAHYQGMGLDFDRGNAKAAAVFDQSEQVTGLPIRTWIESDMNQLKQSKNAQIAISTVSLAIFEAFKAKLPEIVYMAGLSLGEYSALMAAGYLDYEQGFKLLRDRGLMMSNYCEELNKSEPVNMAAVINVPLEKIQELISEFDGLYIANMNSAAQTVIAGPKESIQKLNQRLKDESYKKTIPLKVEGPFHSPYMKGLAPAYQEYLKDVAIGQARTPVISNTNLAIHNAEGMKDILVEHLYKPVQWRQTIERFQREGITHMIQVGPGDTLAKLMERDNVDIPCLVIDQLFDLEKLEGFWNRSRT